MPLDLLSGLAQGFSQGMQFKQQNQWNEELKKLQVKMFKTQLDQEEQQKSALEQITKHLSIPSAQQVSVPQEGAMGESYPPMMQTQNIPPPTMQKFFSTPEGQALGLKAGIGFKDLNTLVRGEPGQALMEAITKKYFGDLQPGNATQSGGGGSSNINAGGPGGLEFTGLKISPDGKVMPDFSRPKFKDEVPSADGLSMIQRDEFGRTIGTRPISPGEYKPAPVPPQSKGQDAIDQEFGKQYAEFKASGGFADTQKQLSQLKTVSELLGKKNNGLTGTFVGNAPEVMLKAVNPDAIAARDAVYDTAQRNLRVILGPQFTEKEGEMLLSRTYDLRLPPAENKKRVDRLTKQIETAAKAKQEASDYFEKNGTLKGFKGRLWTMADFMKDEKPSSGSNKEDPLGIR